MKKTVFGALILGVLLVLLEGLNLPANSVDAGTNELEEVIVFQDDVFPIIKEELVKQYPQTHPVTGDVSISDEMLDDVVWYWDNNNKKVIFVVIKEDSAKWKEVRKDLEARLGEKVVIKKAKKDHKHMRDVVTNEISDFLRKEKGIKNASITWNPKKEMVVVESNELTEELANEIKAMFGSDNVEVVITKGKITKTIT